MFKKTAFQENIIQDIYDKFPADKDVISKVIGDDVFADYHRYAQEEKSTFRKYRFYFKIYRGLAKAYWRLFLTFVFKRCYFGPFNGEFGNFISYILPFLSYLHSKGVKINYCGMALYKPFMVDEKGNLIVENFVELRDFYKEATPNANSAKIPGDVSNIVEQFKFDAKKSNFAYWDLSDSFFYWYIYRTWILQGPFMKTPAFNKIYKTKDENAAVIFPRNKYTDFNLPFGEPWDFQELAEAISPYFDRVYILGHPAFSVPLKETDKIKILVTDNNAVLLEKCANSKLILTQHSGTKYLGELTNTQVLVIYKGKMPIFGMLDNVIFNYKLGTKHNLHFAFSLDHVKEYCEHLSSK